MTAKPKSVKIKLYFEKFFKTHPIVIKYKGCKVDKIDLHISQIDQIEEITFEGFSPNDINQKVSCKLFFNNKIVDIQSISSLQMKNNQYVENVVIKNCKDIYFNGRLDLVFSKHWFKHNILAGANLDDDYVNWDPMHFNDEELFCVGDSWTFGHGVNKNETWPSLLKKNAFNFGSKGLSHDGCLKNIKYILQNSSYVKQIICLLPSPTRKLFNFEFLGCRGTIPISYNSRYALPKEFEYDINHIKELIFEGSLNKEWIETCTDMIELCNKHKVECWLTTWDHEMYQHIPKKNRLPVFPRLNTFKERASDGFHPHKKHYELFAKNIKPYIDNKQN